MPKVYEPDAVTNRIQAAVKDLCISETAMPHSLEAHMHVLVTLGMLDIPGPRVTFAIDPELPGQLRVFVWDVDNVPTCLWQWNHSAIMFGRRAQVSVPMNDTFGFMEIFIRSFAKFVRERGTA
ncbi:MAG: hypothetical protein A2898_01480 [Candidatus Kerfeldbacteria bacterium RIFCSPLOWO2_01_FULL_48_11]|uniref:Uncharacterized protein n=1 Tax=Candidatus Kerfeldbacteria bacterium RIFCSPLOWO2_01_FULL_48_11 TaxID=1798543 RepID=A0A1G2B6Q4_9BACT|nr:MAG: hypothetical protein UY34_C0010G0041 [Parcubacteria group bacterium GW2011_GWA2_48_9]KKW16291.1 MAG: hypothetical protein UY52_C0007G0051 [Parcubacteria group bacterium GW2011_GWC2_49_9]OGY83930.1 MAG: hypothetical protein A2898_01480 [Candidatus Kerfeldbacteria bacterium RIFCSPLOWO2_01_FULL_48_11]HCJ52561.1 hypothetical protein [Candidatus Kerfeldbacteria bacterium]HCM68147.1 hypothetical protein [Candidatus Kerfeldbacteria bacterium]